MKILLIYPNLSALPDIGINASPLPLGLLYIAAALREAGHDGIRVLDASAEGLDHEEVLSRIEEFSPDMVGISSMTIGASEAHELAAIVKRRDPRCRVVFGGAYAGSSPELIIKDQNVDFAVIGEGESTLCELVEALENGKDPSDIRGLAFRNGDAPVLTPPRPFIEDVDSIPFPAWDLVDMDRYFDPARRHALSQVPVSGRMIPIFTSRGCPYGCIYCHNMFGKRVRLRSPGNVLREIELLVERYAPEEIEVWDDIFNYDPERAARICDGIIERGLKLSLSFPNGLRVDRMDEALVDKLKRAGARLIFYAVESASPEVQERMGKKLDLEKAVKIIRHTADRGIFTGGFFMLGFPGETREEMLKTVRFAKEMPFHIAIFNYVTPHPNTPLHAMITEKGVDLTKVRLHHFKKFSVNLSAVPDYELQKIWANAYAGFYLRPDRIYRIWKALPDKRAAFRNIPVVLKLSVFK